MSLWGAVSGTTVGLWCVPDGDVGVGGARWVFDSYRSCCLGCDWYGGGQEVDRGLLGYVPVGECGLVVPVLMRLGSGEGLSQAQCLLYSVDSCLEEEDSLRLLISGPGAVCSD